MAQFRRDRQVYSADNKTQFEVVMLADRLSPTGTMTDAFGRLRVAQPYTLFDSQHRYRDNGKFATAVNGTASATHLPNEASVALVVDGTSGSYVYRETKRVFAYQPGKSLLILNTFAFETPKANLRQRVGYFNTQNGIYLENDGTTNYFVLRSYNTGSVVETRVAQQDWNVDKFDGTGYSAQSVGEEHTNGIDVSKTNILWMDVEWLGAGDVRCGFVVDGRFIPAHVFHNDNRNTRAYMTTAALPIRYEIENTGATTGSSTLKQICSTVMSEGGYEMFGRPRTIGTPAQTAGLIDLPTAGTFYPVVSLRLKSAYQDAIVLPKNIALLGIGNNTRIRWKLVSNPTLTGGTWVSAGTDSNVEYNITATGVTGGVDLVQGYIGVTNQSTQGITLNGDVFQYQLERDPFTSTSSIITLVATGAANGDDVCGSIDWEEV